MFDPWVHNMAFILVVLGLVGCLGRYDYNAVLGLGWIYLSHLHPSLTSSIAVPLC